MRSPGCRRRPSPCCATRRCGRRPLRQLRRAARRGWWRRPPFLPLPSADYVRFRLLTQYGDDDATPTADDVVTLPPVVSRLAGNSDAGRFELETCGGAPSPTSTPPTCSPTRGRVSSSAPSSTSAPSCSALGSTSTSSTLDACRRAGVDVVKRRSGGGVVLVEPGAMCWFDVVVPAGDRSLRDPWSADVGASMRWLGRQRGRGTWTRPRRDAVRRCTDEGMSCGSGVTWSASPGGARGGAPRRAQARRDQPAAHPHGARFQCMVHVRWSPEVLVSLLAEPRPARRRAARRSPLSAS